MTDWDVGHYMKFVDYIEQQGNRRVYKVGDNFRVDVTTRKHDPKSKSDLINIWKKAGLIPEALPTTLHISTTYTDSKGNSYYGRYNIMEKSPSDGRLGRMINFDALREATPENEKELVAECIKQWVEAGHVKEQPLVGRVRFAWGEQLEYTDAEKYIEAIQEELNYRNVTGFEFQTLTKDPAVRKAIDDELYSHYGEENPRCLEDYREQRQGMGQAQEVQPELEDEELEPEP